MPTTDAGTVAVRLEVRGRVQGVGFRPFVYRLAVGLGLAGWVRNDGTGVSIRVQGAPGRVAEFQATIAARPPDGCVVESVRSYSDDLGPDHGFRIAATEAGTPAGEARVPPDRAVCPDCLAEALAPRGRRAGHPFANCTRCGPRYTIIEALPYDRPRTTMARFPRCRRCDQEFADPADRRFHAQPIACPDCGPRLRLVDPAGEVVSLGGAAVRAAADLLTRGRVVAVKGVGGFQLLARADDEPAVRRLRDRKRRPTKPLALMAASTPVVEQFCVLDPTERAALESAENPIVLLTRRPTGRLADAVAPGIRTVGALLPTTPLHALLLAEVRFPVVATSGNVSGRPIATDDSAALAGLIGVVDAYLTHDRTILRLADDSVVRVIAGRARAIRLARGYAPLPLPALERWAAGTGRPAALAVGGHQKSAVAAWTGAQAFLGPHVGDLDDLETFDAFERHIWDLSDLFGFRPALLAADSHPDYASTRWAEASGLRVVRVWHHHAHAVAVMAEHGLLDRDVLALTWDGTGAGDDGTVWGGEALVASATGYRRVASLRPFPLPGGEAAIREPARVAVTLAAAAGEDAIADDPAFLQAIGLDRGRAVELLRVAGAPRFSPQTSSLGRLFDGVAALLGLGAGTTYEGEAAVRLESAATTDPVGAYPLPASDAGGCLRADWRPLVSALVHDRRGGVPVPVVAARFHASLADWAGRIAAAHPGLPVVLGGGCFANRLLTELVVDRLRRADRAVYLPEQVPMNDGGLAVGQLAVALAQVSGGS